VFEFLLAFILLKSLGLLPRGGAIFVGKLISRLFYVFHGRLTRTGDRNLTLAMPHLNVDERRAVVKGVFENLGRLLGEFSQFPKITPANIDGMVVYDGFENYSDASDQGKGVLLLTGHIGAWELCAFAHGVYGHPLRFLVRPLDNPLLDGLIGRYRQLAGNQTIDKNNSVRQVLSALNRNENVGLLIDVNVVADQGVFCDFFGLPACSTTGLAVFALRSGAPVVPGFLIWDEALGKHRLRFEPEIPLVRTGDFKEEVRINTARFTKAVEECISRYPDQWLWIHKRWQTRPEGEPELYGSSDAVASTAAPTKLRAEV
jgi:Kdo2-lipid IVA lauroyltransferase/acyltransferase